MLPTKVGAARISYSRSPATNVLERC